MGAILSKQPKYPLYYFYRFVSKTKNKKYITTYVGKTKDIYNRELNHKNRGYNNINIICKVYCNGLTSRKIEQAFINLFKPTDNKMNALKWYDKPYKLPSYFYNIKYKYE